MHKHERLIRQLAAIPHREFLLHGSPSAFRHARLVPRRPPMRFKHRRDLTRKRIYTTSVILIGLLYAVIRSPSSAWTWVFQQDEQREFRLFIRLEGEEPLYMKRYGHLYVVPREPFRLLRNVLIYSAHAPVCPARTIRVSAAAVIWYLNKEGVQFVSEFPEPPVFPPRAYLHVKGPR